MEVHHHPEVGKKSFKEYLLEGLMIFIAVTLGFFAESLREHINHGAREAEYARAFAADLRVDTTRIDYAIEQNIYNLHRLDSLQDLLLSRNFTPAGVLRAYKLQYTVKNPTVVLFSEGTYKQLHGTGEAGLVRDSISAAIEDYHQGVQDLQNMFTYYDAQMRRMVDIGKNLFRPQYLFGAFSRYVTLSDTAIHIDNGYRHVLDSMAARTPLVFATSDPKVFDNYCSDLGFYMEIIFSYIREIESEKKAAIALLAKIEDTY
ncbi:MAG TPA: hypothetical protein VL547_02765 [Dinghuibacter sp.]|uniref:hypothetical protein n=1 Tax=Dinghuibacter sp. TaxID=2024697 RepID=UPI002B705DCF|nr:hypothetical protein [Dinghuibacter sp.]HTJ10916.1 hypothetical protein [Dinghuibacter sp.]